MEAVAISSANDACVAIAEHISGSTAGFVRLMNKRAQSLGMHETRVVNVHGLDNTPVGKGNRQLRSATSPNSPACSWPIIQRC